MKKPNNLHKLKILQIIICLFIFSCLSNLNLFCPLVLAHSEQIGHVQVYHSSDDNHVINQSKSLDSQVRIYIKSQELTTKDTNQEDNLYKNDLDAHLSSSQWLEDYFNNSDFKNKNSLNFSDNNYIPAKFFKDYVIWLVKQKIDKNFEISVSKDEYNPANKRRSLELVFKVANLDIPYYKLKAHRFNHNGALYVVGNIPLNLRYNLHDFESNYEDHKQFVIVTKNKKIMLDPEIARELKYLIEKNDHDHHNDFDDSDQIVLQSMESCVGIEKNFVFKTSCINFSYKSLYYQAKIDKRGIRDIISSVYSFCGVLKNVHTKNAKDDETKDFTVSICEKSAQKNELANNYFGFIGKKNPCFPKELPVMSYSASFSDDHIIIYDAYGGNQMNSDQQDDTKPKQPDDNKDDDTSDENPENNDNDDDKTNEVSYEYSDLRSIKSQEIHAFAHLNRMYDWFTSLGFESDCKIYIKVSSSMKEGNAFVSWNPLNCSSNIVFGVDSKDRKGGLKDVAIDFDVAGHELGHYVINHSILSLYIDPQNPDLNYRHCKPTDDDCESNHTRAIHEGLADYFVFAATNDPCLGEGSCYKDYCIEECIRQPGGYFKKHPIIYDPNLDKPESMYKYLSISESGGFIDIVSNKNISADIHGLGQMVSGFLWKARTKIKTKKKKQKFDKVILNGLDLAPAHNVSYHDILSAFLFSDEEINDQKFCKYLLQAAEFFNLPLQEKSGIDLENFCNSSTKRNEEEGLNDNIDDKELMNYSIYDNYSLHCKRPESSSEDHEKYPMEEIDQNNNTQIDQSNAEQRFYRRRSAKKSSGCKIKNVYAHTISSDDYNFQNQNAENKSWLVIILNQFVAFLMLMLILCMPWFFLRVFY